MSATHATHGGSLERAIGLPGAMFMGLGSILGTGVFVSIGIAAGIAGPAVIAAVALAAVIATCNGLSSAQLAASHPVSGGTYEYGYRYLSPTLGFVAGWLFLLAKSASAATAALGCAGYVLSALGRHDAGSRVALGVGCVVVITAVVAGGIRRSNRTNTVIVLLTIGALLSFVIAGLPAAIQGGVATLGPLVPAGDMNALLHATALMFVAYTGYGRIATLGEEVRDPERTIPRAVIATLGASMVIYVAVAVVAVAAVGAGSFAAATREAAAPLAIVARTFEVPGVATIVAAGAITAMLGVLLNLVLGLSRVILAMGRRADVPRPLAVIHDGTPRRAVLVVGALIAALVLVGNIKLTWSLSAFTVLAYYAITNLAALRLPASARRYPRWVAVAGLASCLFLAFWVEVRVWLAGLALVAAGLVWHAVARRVSARRATP